VRPRVLRAQENTALFNTKIEESKEAISVAEHLAEGVSTKATSRLLGVSAEAIRRLRRSLKDHSRGFHDERVEDVEATSVQRDERHGYGGSKKEPLWEATAMDPNKSRLLISHHGGKEGDEALIKELMDSTKRKLKDPKDLVLMSDGEKSYESLFPYVFGESPTARHARETEDALNEGASPHQKKPRPPPTTTQGSPRREGRGGEKQGVAHGSWKRVEKELEKLGYEQPNLFSAPSSARTAPPGGCERLFSGQEEPGLRTKRGKPGGGSGMVLDGGLQLLSRPKRVESAILSNSEGRKCYERRTPAMAAKLTEFIWTVADVLRCPVYPARGPG
jgi:hypothetical protein